MADKSDFPIVEGACRHRLRSHGPYGPTWPCNEPRWHLGRHRFRNYTWPRIPHVWRVKALSETWRANRRLRGMGATGGDGLMRLQAVLYPKRFDPLPGGEGLSQ
jgi:hypothetical protein